MTIWFDRIEIATHQSSGYAARTKFNADSAGVTAAFAVDFTTRGELLTRSVARNKYVQIPLNVSAVYAAEALRAGMTQRNVTTLNVAGNGIYTLVKHGWNQERINQFVFDVLLAVNQHVSITKVVSGGQTGVDIAGAVAGTALGVPVVVTMPSGFRQRDANNRDADHTAKAIQEQITSGVKTLRNSKMEINSKDSNVEASNFVRPRR